MATVARENIGLLNDKISITVDTTDYLPAFDKKLKEHTKNANIPGFRKGMVPVGLVKKMYGQALFADEVIRAVEGKLYEYLREDNPEIFAQPLPMQRAEQLQFDLANPGSYTFDFEIGLKPPFDLAPLASANITLHKVDVTDAMVQEEIDRMIVKGGKMTEPETISDLENVINFTVTRADGSGEPAETSLLLKYFTASGQAALQGKSKGDTVELSLAASLEAERLGALRADLKLADGEESNSFRFEITRIGLVEKRELNEEFFNEVFPGSSVATEAEFRTKLKEEIQVAWDAQSRNQLHDQLYHYLIDHTSIQLPETFLKKWLETSAEEKKTAEQVEAEFPMFSSQLRWTLISDKIIQDNNLQVSPEELKEGMRADFMRYLGGMSLGGDMSWMDAYLDRAMKDEKQVENTYRRMVIEKLFAWAEQQIKPTEKVVTAEELQAMQHNHSH